MTAVLPRSNPKPTPRLHVSHDDEPRYVPHDIARSGRTDPATGRATGHADVCQCLEADHAALLAAHPDLADWSWVTLGRHKVGISPFVPDVAVTSDNADAVMSLFLSDLQAHDAAALLAVRDPQFLAGLRDAPQGQA